MTSETTVLHEEGLPDPGELIGPYPHLNYLLVLVGLLIADIATTVWFTSLGLPELNPYIAPIAGSFWAQVAYKCPFALLLIAGTAGLAAACDRLLPGAGKYPWLAVVGIYAIPVAWNLAAIQPAAVPAGAVIVAAVALAMLSAKLPLVFGLDAPLRRR